MEHFREVTDEGYHIRLDLRKQVLGISIPEERKSSASDIPIFATLPIQPSAEFVSAGALAMKAKQFDDGLYAAVECAAQNGAGLYPGKAFLLTTLAQGLAETASAGGTEALAFILGACKLGGLHSAVPLSIEAAVEEKVSAFLLDELRSKPLGFYTWTPELEVIFRQDRFLQSPLGDRFLESPLGDRIVEKTLADIVRANSRLHDAYVVYLDLVSRLTNPPAKSDLRLFLAGADKDGSQHLPHEVFFFPPSRAHETDLVEKLYSDRPIPDSFSLMEELIAGIRSGDLHLSPSKQSGWYDYQIWSIEPLVIPEKMPEAKRLQLLERYTDHLLELFKGVYAMARETHAKQLDFGPAAMCAPSEPENEKIICIAPELSAEPLATAYLRRALSYRFIHKVIVETFGNDALRQLYRLRPTGCSKLNLDEELIEMEALFYGAHAVVSGQLGLPPDTHLEVGSGDGLEADAVRFMEWARSLERDEDLGQDARMMVPVFYDMLRGKTKVWMMLGWRIKALSIYFVTPPQVVAIEPLGTASSAAGPFRGIFSRQSQPKVVFTESEREIACPVFAEAYVEKVLNRDEFRRHCNTFKTQAAILANLA